MRKGAIFVVILSLACFLGYCANIVKLAQCDFESSYKAEIFRSVGVIIPPIGVVLGYVNLKDEKQKVIITTEINK